MSKMYIWDMQKADLEQYLNQHCRFRFRGGKLVYGVIWLKDNQLVFASKDGHEAVLQGQDVVIGTQAQVIQYDDVMQAELIKE